MWLCCGGGGSLWQFVTCLPRQTDAPPLFPLTSTPTEAMFQAIARSSLLAARRQATVAASQQTKRRMGSSAPAPEWTGIDKVVRGYFPKDEQREFIVVYHVCIVEGGQ